MDTSRDRSPALKGVVAKKATFVNALNLSKTSLIGVYGTPSKRYALVRMSTGRYKKVKVGVLPRWRAGRRDLAKRVDLQEGQPLLYPVHAEKLIRRAGTANRTVMESTLFLATLYLGLAVIVVPVAVRMGLGSVLGYLCRRHRPLVRSWAWPARKPPSFSMSPNSAW